jgi:hypothetical protein
MQTHIVKVNKYCTTWLNTQGQLHRLDGPAVEYPNGDREWYQKGKLHRLGGPAAEYANGDRVWYVDDKLHRVDGPAIECADGTTEYWVNGQLLTLAEFEARTVN